MLKTLLFHLFWCLALLCCSGGPSFAQTYIAEISGPPGPNFLSRIIPLDDEHTILIQAYQASTSGAPANIRYIEFDGCGILRTAEFFLENFYGLSRMGEPFIRNDSIHIPLNVNPGARFSHREVSLLSADLENLGFKYKYFRADNTVYLHSLIPLDKNQYLLQCFLSYVDQPAKYGTILLDENFNVLGSYIAYETFTATGYALPTEDGFLCLNDRHVYKLNKQMEPQWSKVMNLQYYTSGGVELETGLASLVFSRSTDDELVVSFIDKQGNLQWVSPDLDDDDGSLRSAKLRFDGEFLWVVRQEYEFNSFNDDIFIHKINPTNGSLVGSYTLSGILANDQFQLSDYRIINGNHVIVATSSGGNQVIWNFEENGGSCQWTPIDFDQHNIDYSLQSDLVRNHNPQELVTGTYLLPTLSSTGEMSFLCEEPIIPNDVLPEELTICAGDSIRVDISELEDDIIWSDGDTSKVRYLSRPGEWSYRSEICDNALEESVFVVQEICECDIYVPNAFSPNDDGVNDKFQIFSNCRSFGTFEILIFDRWGKKVFASNNPRFEWDGRFNDKEPMPGTYVYTISYTDPIDSDSPPFKQHGAVNVIK